MREVREKETVGVSAGVDGESRVFHVLHMGRNCKSISLMLLHLQTDRCLDGKIHIKKIGPHLIKIVFGPAVCLNHRFNHRVKRHLS